MTEIERCPTCGGSNPARAEWCTQCFEPLAVASGHAPPATAPGTPDPRPAPPPGPPPSARRADGPASDVGTDGLLPRPPASGGDAPPSDRWPAGTATTDDTGTPVVVTAGDGRFRHTDEGVEWRCRTCHEWSPIERVSCAVCGTTFLGGDRGAPVPDVEPMLLVAATVAVPGAGHALLRQWGQAFFRAVLALVWGVGGTALLVDALASGQPALPALPLLLGWLVLAATSVNDVLVARGSKGTVLLQGRLLLWLVIGVVGATMGAAFLGAFSAIAA